MKIKLYIATLKARWPLVITVFIALIVNVLANQNPILTFNNHFVNFQIPAPIPYSPGEINLTEAGKPPLYQHPEGAIHEIHWLGTDVLGRDLLSNIIHGFRTSVVIAAIAISITFLLGLIMGAISGYWHNNPIIINPITVVFMAILLIFFSNAIYVQMTMDYYLLSILTGVLFLLSLLFLIIMNKRINHYLSDKYQSFRFKIYPDKIFLFTINLFSAMPTYFVLLAALAIIPNPKITSIAMVLGLLMWTDIARLTRAEMIRLKNTNINEAAKSIGLNPFQIITKHLLPHAIQPAIATIGFAIGSTILAEAFLSFIGIVPAEMISWGGLMSQAREYPSYWWLSVFPGLAIFLIILMFYRQSSSVNQTPAQF